MKSGKELESLQLDLNTYYNTRKNIYFRPLTHEDLAIDGFYAGHHSDGIWYRIKLTIIKGTISGKLIDFGDFTQIRLDRIHPLWPQFRNLPSQSIHASLAGTASTLGTSHSAHVAMLTESDGVKIDGTLYPNFM